MKYKKKSHGFVHISSMQRGKKGRKQSYLLCSDFLTPLWEEGVEEQQLLTQTSEIFKKIPSFTGMREVP